MDRCCEQIGRTVLGVKASRTNLIYCGQVWAPVKVHVQCIALGGYVESQRTATRSHWK